MRCGGCGAASPSGAKFCQECGTAFQRACESCGTALASSAKVCHECGQRVGAAAPVAPSAKATSTFGSGVRAQPIAAPATAPEVLGDGRYRIRGLVGEGAKKRVYLAHDERLERDVALAIIKGEGLDEAGRARVRREATAMARLGDHPNIVTVHDIGEDGETLYIVSQFMSGGDLEHALIQHSDKRRVPIADALRVATQLCGALHHAHSHGVVHRDVKPGNIWLTEDGTAKLGDFGLALSVDRTRLTQEGMMVGTAAYMAPEQALGRSADTRSDLYALGATVYEMLTGRPPFLGDDAVAIISQHINTKPVAPSWHREDVPQWLEALVVELLEKDPTRRPESAHAVLERIERGASASGEARAVEPGSQNPLDRLASGIFVGREEQLQTLHDGLDDALSGKGRILLLVGEPGIGKTRTSEELTTYARMRGAQVLWGRCYEGEGAPSYWPWLQIVRSFVALRDPKQLMSFMGPGAADIAEVVSEVRERIPGLPVPPALEPEQARFRLFDSVTTFLRNASSEQPLVLVLDDLHWSDKPSLLLLEFLARNLAGARILVLGTYRDVEVSRQHPLEQTLAALARTHSAERVLLRGLTPEDVARFIELAAGRTAPRTLIDAVYRETEGNPFFVHEVVRLLQSDGRLDDLESVESWSVEIPQGVRQVIGRRLDALSEECNRVLTIASAIGREFEARVLARVADLDEDGVLELLEQAEDARVIGEVAESPGAYRYSHALVRETLYEEIRTTRRLRLHRRIGEVLEDRYAANPGPHLAELAFHFCEAATGGDVDKAVDYAERAARRAIEAVAFEEAAKQFERASLALEASERPDPLRSCQLILSRADALFRAGLPEEADAIFRQGLVVARELDSPDYFAIAVIGLARDTVVPGNVEAEEVPLLEEALARLGDGHSALRVRLLSRLAGRLIWMAAPERSRRVIEQALAVDIEGEPAVSRLAAMQDRNSLRPFYLGPGRLDEMGPHTTEVVDLAVELGDRNTEFFARTGLQFRASMAGDREVESAQAAERRRLADELRQPSSDFMCLRDEAMRAINEGRLDLARELTWKARSVGSRWNAEAAIITFGGQLYQMRWMQGRLAETEDTLRVGIETYPNAYTWPALLANACVELGRLDEAQALFEPHVRSNFETLFDGVMWGVDSLSLFANVCVATEDAKAAPRIYELMLPLQHQYCWSGPTFCVGPTGLPLGNLATAMGRFGDAERHFEQTIALNERYGALGWQPRTQCDYARMLLVRSGPGDRARALELLDAAMATCQRLGLKGWLDRCIETKLAAQGVVSGTLEGSIDAIAHSIGKRRPNFAPHSAPDGTVTIVFSDMEGFTAMTERLGDYAAREVVREHNRVVREQVAAHGGHEVELQGDGFLLAFRSAVRAVDCAIAIQRAFESRNRDEPESPIRVRIGIHTGEALRERDKFFGRTVILAARIASEAKGGEILVSSDLKRQTESSSALRFGADREVRLKGISDAQRLYAVDW